MNLRATLPDARRWVILTGLLPQLERSSSMKPIQDLPCRCPPSLALLAILGAALLHLAASVQAGDYRLVSLCEVAAGDQSHTLVMEETRAQLRLVQRYSAGGQQVLRVFAAARDDLEETDYSLAGRLDLVRSSLPEDQDGIDHAALEITTEGEHGPIIRIFSIYLSAGRAPLAIVTEANPLPCRLYAK